MLEIKYLLLFMITIGIIDFIRDVKGLLPSKKVANIDQNGITSLRSSTP